MYYWIYYFSFGMIDSAFMLYLYQHQSCSWTSNKLNFLVSKCKSRLQWEANISWLSLSHSIWLKVWTMLIWFKAILRSDQCYFWIFETVTLILVDLRQILSYRKNRSAEKTIHMNATWNKYAVCIYWYFKSSTIRDD